MPSLIAALVLSIAVDLELLNGIMAGYEKDEWCTKLQEK